MKLTRRNFLKSSAMAAGLLFSGIGMSLLSSCKTAYSKLKGADSVSGICPLCSMGCGIRAYRKKGQIINIEGDPGHPVNEGKLCAKGSSLIQLSPVNRNRLKTVKYRPPFSSEWKDISYDEAVKKISEKIRDTREATFIESEDGKPANRTGGMAVFGGTFLTNEEAYLISKMARLTGITHIYNDNDLYHKSTQTALMKTLGYGTMTNNWIDIRNANVLFIIGANPVESHPVLIRHMFKARENGCKIIHVDPRYTRTSSIADSHLRIIPGSDIAFINGLINYALQNDKYHREYVAEYTNASYIIDENYSFKDGIFSGYNNTATYDTQSWEYLKDRKGIPTTDKSLSNGNCVFQIMKRHFSRYTPEKAAIASGCGKSSFLEVAELVSSTGNAGKAACVIFSSGVALQNSGVQAVRALAILQLILGNIGVSGGGINELGSGYNSALSVMGLCPDYLSGHLPAPNTEKHSGISAYLNDVIPFTNDPMSINLLNRTETYLINLLKAFYGEPAGKNTYFCYDWLPKSGKASNHSDIFNKIKSGEIKGAVFAGSNPATGPLSSSVQNSLGSLEWMLVTDMFESETSVFWKNGENPDKIKTEVFLMPSASPLEKEGSAANACRWAQWNNKIIDTPEDARPDLQIFYDIFTGVRKLYRDNPTAFFPEPIVQSYWSYSGNRAIDPKLITKEINGQNLKNGKLLNRVSELKDDGTTSAGNWLFCGSLTDSENMMQRRIRKNTWKKNDLYSDWAWSYPGNTRILYNRAGVDRRGIPWNDEKYPVKWSRTWKGDIVNGGMNYGPAEKNPFGMFPEGVANLFSAGISDGPLPEYYMPYEDPFRNPFNDIKIHPFNLNKINKMSKSGQFPYRASINGIAEGWQPGISEKQLPWLFEMLPDLFCEISPKLAEAKQIKNGDYALIITPYGYAQAACLVTDRIKAFGTGPGNEMISLVTNTGRETGNNIFYLLINNAIDPFSETPAAKAFFADIRRINNG